MLCKFCSKKNGVFGGRIEASLVIIGARLAEPQPSGWSYRLSPHLELRTRGHNRVDPALQVLLVQSGRAFGPGHPTTRLCLDLLRETLAQGPVPRLADVGCGAGVLSLAAAALGVPQVVGLDIAWEAARVTRKNARANGLAGAIGAVQGSTECLQAPFDLVAANLPWEVQLEKAPELVRLVAAPGRLILSGFREDREKLLMESYRGLGWRLQRRLVKDFRHPELPPDLSFTWVAWLLALEAPGEIERD
jgi:ribosomal protein L11 methylase PrmA